MVTDRELVRVTVIVPRAIRQQWRREALERGVSVGAMIRAAMSLVTVKASPPEEK